MNTLYETWLTAWNGDGAQLQKIVHDDFVGHWPNREVRGREELWSVIQMGHEPFSTISFRCQVGPIVDGEFAAGRWTAEGIYRGTGSDDPSSGKQVTFAGADFFRTSEGKIIEYWVSSDVYELMQQISGDGEENG